MASLEKTTGLLLRLSPVSNTSLAAMWLSPRAGRFTTLVKGAYRPKSFFMGQLQCFQTCELLYYPRDGRRIPIARECTVLRPRAGLSREPRSLLAAEAAARQVARVLPEHAPQPRIFTLLSRTMDALEQARAPAQLLLWFELQLLARLGLAPRLMSCARCARPLAGLRRGVLSPAAGGMVGACCSAGRGQDGLAVPPDVLALLRAWQRGRTPAGVLRTVCGAEQLRSLTSVMGALLAHHIEEPPAAHGELLALLR